MQLDTSRPDVAFLALWSICTLLAISAPEGLKVDFEASFLYLILFNITTFFVIYRVIAACYGQVRLPAKNLVSERESACLYRFIKRCFVVWLVIYPIVVVYSGGLPIVWLVLGDSRTYVDFGVPSLSGALNMLRAFMFAGCILLFLRQFRKPGLLLMPAVLLFSSFSEISRGNMVVLLLHGVAIIAIMRPLKLRTMLRGVLWVLFFIVAFGLLGDMRNEGSGVMGMVSEDSIFASVPSGFLWVYLYITTPINNVNYAVAQGIEPLYAPFFSVQSLLPTIIRGAVFEEQQYPITLAFESFNATTFYGPLLADFGMIGAAIVIVCLQIIVSYLHVRMKRGSIAHLLIYPAFYMSLLMSVFYIFFFSMTTVLYPLLAVCYMVYRKKSKKLAECKAIVACGESK